MIQTPEIAALKNTMNAEYIPYQCVYEGSKCLGRPKSFQVTHSVVLPTVLAIVGNRVVSLKSANVAAQLITGRFVYFPIIPVTTAAELEIACNNFVFCTGWCSI